MKTPVKAISQLITKKEIVDQLRELGVNPGMILEVHAALSSFGYVCGRYGRTRRPFIARNRR